MFTDKDPKTYNRSERVIGDVKSARATRGKYGHTKPFMKWVAKNGLDQPAFTNVGRWQFDEAAKKEASVYVPWITVDIDDVDLVEAYENACQVTETLISLGYDPKRIMCSFSGSKGFHVQVDSTQMALPAFGGPKKARIFLAAYFKDVCEEEFWDKSMTSVRSLIRLTGSQHSESGLYKRSFLADDFLARGMNGVMKNVREDYEGFEIPEGGNPLRGPRKHLRSVFDTAEMNYRGRQASSATSKSTDGITDRIKNGVGEGEEFGPKNFHVGRENAAFIMGCRLIEETGSYREAREKLMQWNGLNRPPLPVTRVKAQWRGARRKMQGKT